MLKTGGSSFPSLGLPHPVSSISSIFKSHSINHFQITISIRSTSHNSYSQTSNQIKSNMSGGSAIKTWLLMASIGAVEALKDQGVARWNGPLKALHNQAKSKIVSSYNKSIADGSSRSLIVGSEMASGKYRSKKTKAESMKKVMDMNCFGPSTVRF